MHRYYFLCAEAADHLVLYRREDMVRFDNLGEYHFKLDRNKYYDVMIEGRGGRLNCYLDGKLVIQAKDEAFKSGAAGIRTGGLAAFRDIKVTTDKTGWENTSRISIHQASRT